MGVMGSRSIMEVALAADLSTISAGASSGEIAYAWDTDRHYKFTNSGWRMIATQDEILAMTGKIQTSAGVEYGAWPYPFTAATNSSGVATAYLTVDGTNSTGAAFPTKIFNASAAPIGIGAANYNVTSVVVSGDRKTVTVTLNQIKTVLGLLSFNATADAGVIVQGTIWGR